MVTKDKIVFDRNRKYTEILCEKINNPAIKHWNIEDWLSTDLQDIVNNEIVIDEQIIADLKPIIKPDEVLLFGSKTDYNYKLT